MKKIENFIIFLTEYRFDDYGRFWLVHLFIRVGWLVVWFLTIKASMIAGYCGGLMGRHF